MYGRIVGSSSQSTSASQVDDSRQSADSDSFAERLAETTSNSGSISGPYSLRSRPPIEEIDRSSFRREMRAFYGDDIKHIADNPQDYSEFVSSKAERTAQVARVYGHTDEDTDKARYFSYQLGDKVVGLLRTEGGRRVRGERFQQQFPGRDRITSVVDLRVTHPLVENAGDILLEHQLRVDGERPLLMSRPALPDMESRLMEMGFIHMGDNRWVLDPTQHPEKWTRNAGGEWQRADKGPLYLVKAESRGTDSEASVETDSGEARVETDSSDDDPSWYFERLNLGSGSAAD
ncbi:host specificity protein [Bradyrhizobium sp. CB3481]|uniref:host specificity protein n=1 Tax=Bradyrhizobium sp. CB3481 TaxID=3039158 RepID=UPI0024B24D91|nr:host specificity protein [Bradyrhizobium sp. CB3481]WFU14722.1 host specificity protein [Bradyrhizobium sp. CB3481]